MTSWNWGDATLQNRPYKMLEHARELLSNKKGEFFRADAISTLKRALDVRLKSINEIYNFDKLFGSPKVHLIEALEICGILRPLMLRQLLDIRNLVEHKDRNPPSFRRCSEFEDYVWYFLKSTDKLLGGPFSTFDFIDPNSLNFEYDLDCSRKTNWDFKVSGWFRRAHVSRHERKGWLCCRIITFSTYTEHIKEFPNYKSEDEFKYPLTDVRLSAEFSINMQNELHRKFINRCFNAL